MNAKQVSEQQAITIRNLTIERDDARHHLKQARQAVLHEAAKVAEYKEQLDAIRKLATDTAGDPADILAAIVEVLK
jgi:hypothetical protein